MAPVKRNTPALYRGQPLLEKESPMIGVRTSATEVAMFWPSEKSVASCKGAFGERVQNQEASPARILRQSMMISLPTGRLAGNFPPCFPPPFLLTASPFSQE